MYWQFSIDSITDGKYFDISLNLHTVYVVIFEWLNLQKQFVGQYYKKIISKIGGNHFKRYITCANYEFLFSKNAQFLKFL